MKFLGIKPNHDDLCWPVWNNLYDFVSLGILQNVTHAISGRSLLQKLTVRFLMGLLIILHSSFYAIKLLRNHLKDHYVTKFLVCRILGFTTDRIVYLRYDFTTDDVSFFNLVSNFTGKIRKFQSGSPFSPFLTDTKIKRTWQGFLFRFWACF